MFLDNELLLTVIYYKTFQQVQSSGGTTGERGPLHGVKSRKTGNCLYKVVKTDEFLKILAPTPQKMMLVPSLKSHLSRTSISLCGVEGESHDAFLDLLCSFNRKFILLKSSYVRDPQHTLSKGILDVLRSIRVDCSGDNDGDTAGLVSILLPFGKGNGTLGAGRLLRCAKGF